MDDFLMLFEDMPVWQRLSWVIGCLAVCWVLEGQYPLFRFDYKKWKHAGTNFVFLTSTLAINAIFGLAAAGVFTWIGEEKIGLLYMVELPTWAGLILAVLFFELIAQYGIHFLLHRVKWMWKFHMIHHSDTHLDATSGTRHHPGDFFMREASALLAVVITGAPASYYFFYRICTVFFTYFTHANISLPLWLDKALSLVFITPNMHKFHHHFERPWTDSNYGNIFSVWDRLFGTFVYDDPAKIRYGLDVLDPGKDQDVRYQLGIPFDQRIKTDY
jgi:sterol desaturase/sphingolipid hydroxylase (fatty acid hydroxylase superfamily)